ncbi:MAG: hypothetical protein ACI35P_17290 [Bacillus sp. (in: firmicutes)]
MEVLIIILLLIAIVLFLLSFVKKDRISNVENTIDELSLQHVQDIYQLKKRIRVLEEELLTLDSLNEPVQPVSSEKSTVGVNKILESQVLALYQQGLTINDIIQRSALTKDEVMTVIENSQLKGL